MTKFILWQDQIRLKFTLSKGLPNPTEEDVCLIWKTYDSIIFFKTQLSSPFCLLPLWISSYLPPSKRLMRSDILLDFSFETQEAEAGLTSSILGAALDKALCLGFGCILDKGEFCRCNGFGGTVEKEWIEFSISLTKQSKIWCPGYKNLQHYQTSVKRSVNFVLKLNQGTLIYLGSVSCGNFISKIQVVLFILGHLKYGIIKHRGVYIGPWHPNTIRDNIAVIYLIR